MNEARVRFQREEMEGGKGGSNGSYGERKGKTV